MSETPKRAGSPPREQYTIKPRIKKTLYKTTILEFFNQNARTKANHYRIRSKRFVFEY